ncbi:hypothetical protein JZ751_020394 [Albula glossodonta]|uniref:Uncharacterized protein n=1 Tax=Albula glossodonta TaxID=121402 RepID=A0A8T2MSI4_9TELE|nr:hypothetical protein JZ751_020394 [Albula glossodonta]
MTPLHFKACLLMTTRSHKSFSQASNGCWSCFAQHFQHTGSGRLLGNTKHKTSYTTKWTSFNLQRR